MALLTLNYGDRMEKTWEAHHVAEQEGLSYREAEWVVESNLFPGQISSMGPGVPTSVDHSTQNVPACRIMRA